MWVPTILADLGVFEFDILIRPMNGHVFQPLPGRFENGTLNSALNAIAPGTQFWQVKIVEQTAPMAPEQKPSAAERSSLSHVRKTLPIVEPSLEDLPPAPSIDKGTQRSPPAI